VGEGALVTGLSSPADRRSYYSSTLAAFCAADRDAIFAQMARQNVFDLTGTQRHAWLEQAAILQTVLARYTGSIYLEFTIPRMGRRIDVVVIIGAVIFVIEFKVGEDTFYTPDLDQVVDYALDLHNFHEGSHDAYIAPVLVCTAAHRTHLRVPVTRPADRVFEVARTNSELVSETIQEILRLVDSPGIEIPHWE
jgi:hypothetical protein